MNRKLFAAAVCMASALAAVTVGCQTYDFQPVEPLALAQEGQYRDLKQERIRPNIMLLVDKSGSMNQPANPALAGCNLPSGGKCPQGSALCDPTTCPTRWSELQKAMQTFFSNEDNRRLARFGVTTYPTDAICGNLSTPAEVRENIPQTDDLAELSATASRVNTIIQGIQMVPSGSGTSGTTNATGGGTPTGGSIRQISSLQELTDATREDVILLLTDGLPNCNPSNPNDQDVNAAQCKCTLAGGSGCVDAPPYELSKLGCLDQAGTVAEIQRVATDLGIRTAVIGLGSETGTGDGPIVLGAMALAGGLDRRCPNGTTAECGGGTCNPDGTCATPYYQASNADELGAAIDAIGRQVSQSDDCHYALTEVPESEDFISVLAGPSGATLQRQAPGADTWRLEPSANLLPPCTGGVPCVVLQGALCTEVKASTQTSNPYRVEVRALYPL